MVIYEIFNYDIMVIFDVTVVHCRRSTCGKETERQQDQCRKKFGANLAVAMRSSGQVDYWGRTVQ